MKKQIWISGPSVHPIIERNGQRYVIDLKLGHFRELSSPYHVIPFSCSWGKELARSVGIWACEDCGESFMAAGVSIGLRCVRCGSLIDTTHRPEDVVRHKDDGLIEAVVLEVEG